jgi:hypothetical protein
MQRPNVAEQFSLLVEAAQVAASRWDVVSEPYLSRVLDYILLNMNDREIFDCEFRRMISSMEDGFPEIVEFCMYKLRWQEVRDMIIEKLSSSEDERMRHVLSGMLDSFSDEWGGVKFYKRFMS